MPNNKTAKIKRDNPRRAPPLFGEDTAIIQGYAIYRNLWKIDFT